MKAIRLFLLKVFTSVFTLFLAAYPLVIRRRLSRWGTHKSEHLHEYPGDELVPLPRIKATRAVTIAAKPDKVFPWLLQIGRGRGGFYSYQIVEELIGAGRPDIDHILLEHQNLNADDHISLMPWGLLAYRVEAIYENEALIMWLHRPNHHDTIQATWVFSLQEIQPGLTRLIARTRMDYEPKWTNFLLWRVLFEPVHFIMEWRLLNGIKARVERPDIPAPAEPLPA